MMIRSFMVVSISVGAIAFGAGCAAPLDGARDVNAPEIAPVGVVVETSARSDRAVVSTADTRVAHESESHASVAHESSHAMRGITERNRARR